MLFQDQPQKVGNVFWRHSFTVAICVASLTLVCNFYTALMTDTHFPNIDSSTESAVLQTLAYFEVFSYTLTKEEIFAFCGAASVELVAVEAQLQLLVNQGLVFQYGLYYQTKEEPSWVTRRLDCNRRAADFLPKARRMAHFIGQFPFVRGVFVSGSLSKECMGPESDVDFFIVTAPGRLWLARTLLVVFKKLFLLNSHKYFCINYFVDSQHLEIEEKNLFTATESVTLLPMWGNEYYQAFYSQNTWAWKYYPHFALRNASEVPPTSKGFFKSIAERVLAGKLGEWLDQKTMQLTIGFWKKKFKHLDSSTFDLALKSRKGISKHHPLHFQQKVLKQLNQNLERIYTLKQVQQPT